MSRTARTYLLFAAFVVLLGAVLAGALAQIPDLPATPAVGQPVVVAPVAPAPAPVVAPDADVDAAFLADLVGPDTDLSAEDARVLLELRDRYCDLVVRGLTVPGAEQQTREGWIDGLTGASPTGWTGWTRDEAGAFLDRAEAACPTPAV